MKITIYYRNCWLDIETKNFKKIKKLENHIKKVWKEFKKQAQ